MRDVPTRSLPSPAPEHRHRGDPLLVALASTSVAAIALTRVRVGYWIDEGITVGIARRPATTIPGLLRRDGNPPGYYELLHGWIRCFGASPASTHVFSALIVTAFVPVLWWSAVALLDRRAARLAVALAAGCPFLAWYGAETRMYALTALLGLVAVTNFLRWLDRPGVAPAAAAVLSAAAVLWVQDWGCYLLVGLVAVGVGQRRSPARLAGFVVGVIVVWSPWLPSIVFQARHTGAPWARPPGWAALVTGPLSMVAGSAPGMVLLGTLTGIVAWGLIARRPVRSVWQPLFVISATVVGCGWIGGRINGSWNDRYLGVLLGPLLLLLAVALARIRLVAFLLATVILASTTLTVLRPGGHTTGLRSNVALAAAAVRPYLAPGDEVLALQTSELPVIGYYLGHGFRYANPMGPAGPTSVDWVDLTARLGRVNPEATIIALKAGLSPGGHLVLMGPAVWPARPTGTYNREVRALAVGLIADAGRDPDLALVRTIPAPTPGPEFPVAVWEFVRR